MESSNLVSNVIIIIWNNLTNSGTCQKCPKLPCNPHEPLILNVRGSHVPSADISFFEESSLINYWYNLLDLEAMICHSHHEQWFFYPDKFCLFSFLTKKILGNFRINKICNINSSNFLILGKVCQIFHITKLRERTLPMTHVQLKYGWLLGERKRVHGAIVSRHYVLWTKNPRFGGNT